MPYTLHIDATYYQLKPIVYYTENFHCQINMKINQQSPDLVIATMLINFMFIQSEQYKPSRQQLVMIKQKQQYYNPPICHAF